MTPFRLQDIFLHPGEFHFGPSPGRIGTLLGSCVAVTVWHPKHRFGGMCHILLPNRQRPPGAAPDGRYADEAIERFSYELKSKSVQPGSCQVKLFGGSAMLASPRTSDLSVGERNVEATRAALSAHRFPLMDEHVGGNQRRRLFLDLSSGHVWMILPNNTPPRFQRKDAT